ncbi:hypothetical protein TCSYLVIO_005031 [Trypanosoma cruzi]|nr:hypothetical protein TCSYLVIO_005031 [Trypanosoma cruzi]
MVEEDTTVARPALWEATPTPMVESFHAAIWYILRYCGNVIDAAELLSWRTLLQIPLRVTAGMRTSIRMGEELELFLRLALRIPTWMQVRQIEEQCAEQIHVRLALDRLSKVFVDKQNDGEEISQDDTFLRIMDGKGVAKLLLANNSEDVKEVLQTARVRELRQLAQLQREDVRRGKQKEEGEVDTKVCHNDYCDGDTVNIKSAEAGTDDFTTGKSPAGVRRSSTGLPSRKEDLIHHILAMDCSEALFAATWDAVVGPICRVHKRLKESVCRVCELLHVLTCHCGTGGIFSVLGRFHPTRPLSAALWLLAPRLLLQRDVRVVCMPTPPWWQINGVSGEGPFSVLAPLCLFSSSSTLTSYVGALRLHQKLIEATVAKGGRGGGLVFAMASHNAVEDALVLLQQQQPLGRKREYPEANNSGGPSDHVSCGRMCSQEAGAINNEGGILTVEIMLQRGGLLYEHLLPFLPKYAWFACAELLVPLLQYKKRYDLANQWLQRLLEEPVHIVKSACGAVTFPFYYRPQKRGKWWHRVAQNLALLGNKKAALEILEKQQRVWRQHSLTTHHRVCVESFKSLPVTLQRRVRLLSAVFPSVKGTSRGAQNSVALYNAVNEHHRLHSCRRFDRIAIERTLASLHCSLLRWTPLPTSHTCFTNQLFVAKELTIYATRDAMEPNLWGDPSHSMASCSVEKHALRWFGAGPSQNTGWLGLHCEGRWLACLARLLLWDAYVFVPTRGGCEGVELETTAAGVPDYIWLSPLQDHPLDLISSTAFCQRRRRIIEERLEFFEACSRETLIEYVKRRCRLKDTPNSSDSNPVRDGLSGREELQGESESEVSLLSSEDGELVLLGQPNLRQDERQEDLLPSFFFHDNASVSQKVDVGELHLLSLLQAIPQVPLCALLRRIYLSPPEEGYSICFSGFPDLVLWRETPLSLVETEFKLVEVKSPNDRLSDKQMAAIDVLCRCGFDVTVARVVESDQTAKRKGPSKNHRLVPDRVQDGVLLDAEHVPE